METSSSFMVRHEFLIYRLFSLAGLVPVGAYLIIHLLTNATLLDSPAMYQRSVYTIHGLGMFLLLIEWLFIFAPLIFHAVLGLFIVKAGQPNSMTYRYNSNVRFTLQRATGMIAFAFIFWHVFHMHGWFHNDWWLRNVAEPLGGHLFRPYNAGSSTAEAMQATVLVPVVYAIGTLASVFHLANGVWTAGITWGAWTNPRGMKRAGVACTVFGVLLAGVAVGALWAPMTVDVKQAREIEDRMYEALIESGQLQPDPGKRSQPLSESAADAGLQPR